MKILFQTLLPKEINRHEYKHVDENIRALKQVIPGIDIQIASVVKHPQYDITLFDRIDSTTYLKKHPEWKHLERRFEIIAGKRILLEYAKQSTYDKVIFTDSDQSMPDPEDWKKCLKDIDCVRIPVVVKEDMGNTYYASYKSDSFSFYIIDPKKLWDIELLDLTKILKAKEGECKPYAPDNTLFNTLKQKGLNHTVVPDVTTYHESDDAIYKYENKKVSKIMK